MVTALILSRGGVGPLAATLAALVPAVADGVVAGAVVISPAPDEAVAQVADGVGAAHCVPREGEDPWLAGAALARRDWLLCLEAGDVPAEGWMLPVERFVALAAGPRIGLLGGRSAAAAMRGLRETLVGIRRPAPGHVLHRALLGPAGLRQRLRPARIAARVARDPSP